MKKRLAITGLIMLIICLLITISIKYGLAWTAIDLGGADVGQSAVGVPADLNGQLAFIQHRMSFRNKSGSSIAVGEPVKIDGTSITVVTNAAAADDMTIANDLSAEGGWYYPMVVVSTNQGDTLTCTITGTDQDGAAQTETVTFTAAGVIKKSSKLWKTISDFDAANLSGNVQIYAYCPNGITDAASDNTNVVGFATAAIADNAEGDIATIGCSGAMEVPCRGAAIIPGDTLSPAGSGYLDEDTKGIAVALEPTISAAANESIRVLLMREND